MCVSRYKRDPDNSPPNSPYFRSLQKSRKIWILKNFVPETSHFPQLEE